MRLQGKVAMVTGGAKGLGRAFCLALAKEGAAVMAVDVKNPDQLEETARQVEALGGRAAAFIADVTSESDAKAMARACAEKLGGLDILVNNAAIYDGLRRKPFDQIDLAEWDMVLKVNVKGAFLAIRAAYPFFKKSGRGKVVNLASEVFFTGSHGFAHYVASKGGIIGLSRALAVELGPEGICVNCLAPGFTDTEASRSLADINKYDTSKTPLKRLGQPEDLIGALLFLVSAESDFITGQTLLVDGGRAMH